MQLQTGNADPVQIEKLMKQYQADTKNIALLCNLILFQPLIWYILFKTYKGYKAYKNNEIVDPKSWAVK
jgi:hypothetical protein